MSSCASDSFNCNHCARQKRAPMLDCACSFSMSSGAVQRWAPNCYCGDRAALRTADTTRNCGKRFWGCRTYMNGKRKCQFFDWYKEEVVDEKDLVIVKMCRKIQSMEANLDNTRKWIKLLMSACILLIASNMFALLMLGYGKY